MTVEKLVSKLTRYNQAYRKGVPLVSDAEYDALVAQLQELDPENPFLHKVEPEQFTGRIEVRHPAPMLSTEKAYSVNQLQRFVTRVEKEASHIGLDNVFFRVTPKLDGLAGRDDGTTFASRGNGLTGYEISSAFEKGVVPIGGRGQGLGEIVVVQSYFEEHLSDRFEHPRNMVVGIISSDTLNEDAIQALKDGKVHFVPYHQLDFWQGNGKQLLSEIETITDDLLAKTDYPLDGVVVSAVGEALQQHMGATAHHYRWQIAVKRKGEISKTIVETIQWQVGRTGNVTPVLVVAPVNLSGATIRRVTAHNAGMVNKLGIGPGAHIEIIRSGEVIPKLEKVITRSEQVSVPENCPVCHQLLRWQKDFLKCDFSQCPAQIEQRISHWFRVLGSADWFGIKTIQKLVAQGYNSLEAIYELKVEDFLQMEFGPVQSKNLAEALIGSRTKRVEDWRFLAAFGIPDLGVGDSRRLLTQVPLKEIIKLDVDTISNINGFGVITSRSIVHGIAEIKETFLHMQGLGFNLERTILSSELNAIQSPVAGKRVVFSGTMQGGSREEMQAQARKLGATVQNAVSSNTDLLICGDRVGTKKLEKASRLGVEVLSEQAYAQLINGS